MLKRRLFQTALSTMIAVPIIYSQTSTGEVNGNLTDPASAAVPGAVVKLVNQETKIENQVVTNQNGYFLFVNVKPGSYVLTVELSGKDHKPCTRHDATSNSIRSQVDLLVA